MSKQAVAVQTMPSYMKDSGRGNENVGQNLTIPRIKQLQKMSPEVDKHSATYMAGAEPGNFVNSLTGQNYGDEVYVISLTFKDEWVVWRDRNKGGGLLGSYPSEAAALAAIAEQETPEEYEPVQTHSHVMLIKDPETGLLETQPVIMDFTKTKLRYSKDWNSQIAMKGGDRFSTLWKLVSVSAANKAGQTYSNVKPELVGWAQEDDYKAAEAMYETYA